MAGDPFKHLVSGEPLDSGVGPFSVDWHNAMTGTYRDVQRMKAAQSATSAKFARDEIIRIANISGEDLVRGGVVGIGAICAANQNEIIAYSAAPQDDEIFAILLDPIPAGPYYVSLIADNVGVVPPDLTMTNWLAVQGSITPGAHSGVTDYVRGNLVSHGGSTYVCIKANTNVTPPDSDYWTVLSSGVTNRFAYRHTKIYALGDLVIIPAIGKAQLTGEVRAYVSIGNTSHEYAIPVDDDYGNLVSQASISSARIMLGAPENALLNGGINNSVTTITVESASSWPDAPFVIQIDSEQLNVTAVSGLSWTVTRAYNSTSAASHSDGATVTFKSGTVLARVLLDLNNSGSITSINGDTTAAQIIDSDDESIAIDNSTPGTTDLMVMKATTSFGLTGVVAASQITSDQNDYNPTGLSNGTMLLVWSDAPRIITGIAGGFAGRILTVYNVGSFLVVLSNADSGSSASNRFDCDTSIYLPAKVGTVLQYNGSTSRWNSPNKQIYNAGVSPINAAYGGQITINDAAEASRGTISTSSQVLGSGLKAAYGFISLDRRNVSSADFDRGLTVGYAAHQTSSYVQYLQSYGVLHPLGTGGGGASFNRSMMCYLLQGGFTDEGADTAYFLIGAGSAPWTGTAAGTANIVSYAICESTSSGPTQSWRAGKWGTVFGLQISGGIITNIATPLVNLASEVTGQLPTANIADNAVTDGKLRDSAAVSVIGRSANSSGDPADIAAADNDRLLTRVGDALAFTQLTVGMAPDDVWTNAKLANMAAWTLKARNAGGTGDPQDVALADLAAEASPASGDYFFMILADGSFAKCDVDDLPGGSATDNDAIHDNVSGEIAAITEKTTPHDNDLLVIEDSEASNAKKRLKISNLPGGSGTDADAIHVDVSGEIAGIASKGAPVDGDYIVIEDSEASNAKKSVQMAGLATYLASELGTSDALHDNVSGEIAGITGKTTLVDGDYIVIEDSEASNAKKSVQLINLAAYIGDEIGAGDVVGPSSATDNAIARYDSTTGELIQDSLITISDAGAMGFPDGVKQIFNPDSTNAGFNWGSYSGNPSSLSGGDAWYDSGDSVYKGREGITTVEFYTTNNPPPSGFTAATQAEQEAGSSTTVGTTPGRQHFHPSAAKVWCVFNTSGTVAAGYNVSSVTDHGTGTWSPNYSTSFSSANYAWGGMCFSGSDVWTQAYDTGPATGSCKIACVRGDRNLFDPTAISFWAFGDHS